ncbi:hypothetical protein CF8_0021 [Aeromonas phage CF8]|nr:hypothetical protein CF8_0021 [Aeromonas phage CF8]
MANFIQISEMSSVFVDGRNVINFEEAPFSTHSPVISFIRWDFYVEQLNNFMFEKYKYDPALDFQEPDDCTLNYYVLDPELVTEIIDMLKTAHVSSESIWKDEQKLSDLVDALLRCQNGRPGFQYVISWDY